MANGSIESCSDPVILQDTRMEARLITSDYYYYIQLPDEIIIGRSAFAQIGRYDSFAVAEKSNAPEGGKARESASRAWFEKLRNLANVLVR